MPRNPTEANQQMAAWHKLRAKEARRAAAIEAAQPAPRLEAGEIVEIKGEAKVDVTDAMGHESSNHRDALAQVESSYYSASRGETVSIVRTEDNQLRGVPEHRLRSRTAPAKTTQRTSSARASMVGVYAPGQYEAIFGKQPKGRS